VEEKREFEKKRLFATTKQRLENASARHLACVQNKTLLKTLSHDIVIIERKNRLI